jgi:hypothetical protein
VRAKKISDDARVVLERIRLVTLRVILYLGRFQVHRRLFLYNVRPLEIGSLTLAT